MGNNLAFVFLQLHGKEYFGNTPFLLNINWLELVLVANTERFGITK